MHMLHVLFFCLALIVNFDRGEGNIVKGHVKIYGSDSKIEIQRGGGYEVEADRVKRQDSREANNPDHHVYVSLHPLDFKPSFEKSSKVNIRQHEKTFIPCVTAVTVGSTVYFLNDDEFFHNVYSLTRGSRFNIGRRPSGNSYPQKIKKKGVIKLSCDIHAEMRAVILSYDTPYFQKLDGNGNFEFKNLPDGRYRIEVYHLDYRKIEGEIRVENNEILQLNFAFNGKA